MNGLRPWHIIVLAIIILLLFGANKLPGLARSVGQSMKIFRDEMKDLNGDKAPSTTPTDQSSAGTGAPDAGATNAAETDRPTDGTGGTAPPKA